MAAADPRIRVVHHPVNRKLGGSMKTGFATATGDLVLYTDADLPFDMSELSRAVRLMRYYDADIVSAYRFDRTGEGSLRAVYTFFYNFLIGCCSVCGCATSTSRSSCAAADLRPHRAAAARGRSSTPSSIIRATQAGLRRHPVRRRLLPPHPGRDDPRLAGRDPQDRQRDGRTCAGSSRASRSCRPEA